MNLMEMSDFKTVFKLHLFLKEEYPKVQYIINISISKKSNELKSKSKLKKTVLNYTKLLTLLFKKLFCYNLTGIDSLFNIVKASKYLRMRKHTKRNFQLI